MGEGMRLALFTQAPSDHTAFLYATTTGISISSIVYSKLSNLIKQLLYLNLRLIAPKVTSGLFNRLRVCLLTLIRAREHFMRRIIF